MATERLKNATELKGGLNGLKTILGAALVVLAHQMNALGELIEMFPQYADVLEVGRGYLAQLSEYVAEGLKVVSKLTSGVGNVLLGSGFLHKIFKLIF